MAKPDPPPRAMQDSRKSRDQEEPYVSPWLGVVLLGCAVLCFVAGSPRLAFLALMALVNVLIVLR